MPEQGTVLSCQGDRGGQEGLLLLELTSLFLREQRLEDQG